MQYWININLEEISRTRSKIGTAFVTSRGWKNHTQGKFGFYLSFINHDFPFILFIFHGLSLDSELISLGDLERILRDYLNMYMKTQNVCVKCVKTASSAYV